MMKLFAALAIFLFFGQVFFQDRLDVLSENMVIEDNTVVLPAAFLEVVALEYRPLLADLYFLQALNTFGKTLEKGGTSVVGENVSDWEWRLMFDQVKMSSALDPQFLDPYYFANAIITYYESLVPEITRYLEEGAKERFWDWELPFYVGFNYFFNLDEPGKASDWLMDASRRTNNRSSVLVTLASRLAYQGQKTENAIIFLRGMIAQAEDDSTRRIYSMRLKSLEGIYLVEKAVKAYRQKFGTDPDDLESLVGSGVLLSTPEDPYGGTYYLDEDKNAKTTSNFRPIH